MVSRGLVSGRGKAYALIVAGAVKVNGASCRKPDSKIDTGADISCETVRQDYVSRGGKKLEKALDVFGVSVEGLTALDAGASTGGFTDCLLRRGAAAVIAVDVGYGQLAWSLRQDERVTVLERVNVRHLELSQLPGPADIATLDLSFISLKTVMPAVVRLLTESGVVLALVKPQFEIGKGRVGGSGVVRRLEDHVFVLVDTAAYFLSIDLSVLGMSWSPVVGPKGNIEFWMHLSKKASVGYANWDIEGLAAQTAAGAHAELDI